MSDALRPTTPQTGQHFRQFNALVDTHLRYAPTPILKAVLAVMRCANTEGESYVTPSTIAEKTGMSLRNAQRAIAGATAAGLLSVVAEGGGRGKSTLRRLALAETPAQCATVCGKETPALANKKPRRSAPNHQRIHQLRHHPTPTTAGKTLLLLVLRFLFQKRTRRRASLRSAKLAYLPAKQRSFQRLSSRPFC